MTTRKYTVLYTTVGHPTPVSFTCQASSPTDARAQCVAAHPGCAVVVVR